MFTGFPPETLQFFLDIRYHNDAAYYNANRDRFEKDVKAPFFALIEELLPVLQLADEQMETRPYKCLARLRRDTRFSKDKTPYRDHLWVWFHRAAEPREGSLGFWFELGLQGVSWGMGGWGENRPMMERFRRELAAKPEEIASVIRQCGLERHQLLDGGREWKKMEVPPHIPPDMRSWYLRRELYISQQRPDMNEVGDRRILEHVRKDFQTLTPIYRLLRGMGDAAAAELEESAKNETGRIADRAEW